MSVAFGSTWIMSTSTSRASGSTRTSCCRPPTTRTRPASPNRSRRKWSVVSKPSRSPARSASAACRPDWSSSARRCAATGCARRRARRRCRIISRTARSRAPWTATRRRRRSCAPALDMSCPAHAGRPAPSRSSRRSRCCRPRPAIALAGGRKNCVSFIPSGPVIRGARTRRAPCRPPLDDAAEDVGVVAVDPGLARLRDEGQRPEALHRVRSARPCPR